MRGSALKLLPVLLPLALTACFDSGKSSDDDDDGGGDGDGGGWDVGGDTGDTWGTDSSDAPDGTDGGDTDGWDTDTDGTTTDETDGWDTDTDGTTDETDGWDTDSTDADTDTDSTDGGGDTGILLAGYRGEALVRPLTSYTGEEDSYYEGLGPIVDCAVTSVVTSIDVIDACDGCEWAFEVETSDSEISSTRGCSTIGITDPSGWDGNTFIYGWDDEYDLDGEPISALMYQIDGEWYAVAYAEFSGGTFTYDWPTTYYYYYR